MVVAILAALAAVVAFVAAVAVIAMLRSRTKTPYAGKTKEVRQLDTVGVGSSNLGRRRSDADSDVHVASDHASVKKPADSLRPRFAAMGAFTAAVFGTLAVKLWGMQVLSGGSYAKEAEENLYTTVYTPAPRGFICDADGIPLVKNRTSHTVLAEPDAALDRDTVRRLSAVLGVPANVVRQRMQDSTGGAQSQRVVASDVRLRDAAFIAEHADAFPSITVEARTVRDYPYGALAAHVLGYVGSVTESQLETQAEGRGLESSDDVGQSGIEYQYDRYLAGDHGTRRVVVNAEGNIVEVAAEVRATNGSDVRLTIKGPVQYVVDRALAALVAPEDGAIGTGKGTGAAAVVLDVRDGGVVAMGSYPTYDPSTFVGGIPTDVWNLYQTEEAHNPLLNRVVDGAYPAASTFKAFSSLAALKYGFADTTRTWHCTGSWDGFETGAPQKCWLRTGHGDMTLRDGIVNSCDVVFYEIAKDFFFAGTTQGGSLSDTALQEEIMRYGFGSKTGVDLPSEAAGIVPTPEWKAERWRNVPSEGTWKGGDLTNLVIGQGDVQVTPMQMAVAYAAIATGKLLKPHVFKEVRNANDDVVVSCETEELDAPDVDAKNLAIVRDALHGVVQDSSALRALFTDRGIDAAGKTGTGEHGEAGDDAWFACYAPYDDPKYVVVCTVEYGGGGSAVAAPLAAEIMEAVMAADEGTIDPLMGRIAGSTGKEVKKKDEPAETAARVD